MIKRDYETYRRAFEASPNPLPISTWISFRKTSAASPKSAAIKLSASPANPCEASG